MQKPFHIITSSWNLSAASVWARVSLIWHTRRICTKTCCLCCATWCSMIKYPHVSSFQFHTAVHLWSDEPSCCRGDAVGSTWWRNQMETFSALLALCAGNPPVTVNQTGDFMFSLICAWTNGENNRGAGDLRRHRAHYDLTVTDPLSCMWLILWKALYFITHCYYILLPT